MKHFLTNHYESYMGSPKLTKLDEPLEQLAKMIVAKGLLRISTGSEYNFCLFPMQNGQKYLSISRREIKDPNLIKRTRKIIEENLLPSEKTDLKNSINYKFGLISNEIDKFLPISEEHELGVARLVVQSSEPVIIKNLIIENIYFYISFTQNISDLLSVKNWETGRFSQGLQSNSIQEASIFASCGGNPFFDPEISKNEYDGIKARDRLCVILAQEIGHYADIIKDQQGRNIDRFSALLNLSAPKKRTENARQKDLQNTAKIKQAFINLGVNKVYDLERMVKLQAKFNKKTLKYVLLNLRMNIAQTNFISRCKKKGLGFVAKLAKRNDEIANTCMVLCGDMEFNLNPASAAYRNNNKDVEKAIYCAEALARMPQQKIKWGAEITRFFAPHLYRVFYAVVIKEEYHFHRALTGEKFQLSTKKRRKGLFK